MSYGLEMPPTKQQRNNIWEEIKYTLPFHISQSQQTQGVSTQRQWQSNSDHPAIESSSGVVISVCLPRNHMVYYLSPNYYRMGSRWDVCGHWSLGSTMSTQREIAGGCLSVLSKVFPGTNQILRRVFKLNAQQFTCPHSMVVGDLIGNWWT